MKIDTENTIGKPVALTEGENKLLAVSFSLMISRCQVSLYRYHASRVSGVNVTSPHLDFTIYIIADHRSCPKWQNWK